MKCASVKQRVLFMCCVITMHTTFGEIYRDLELDTLCSTIDRTKTQLGFDALHSLLSHPITDQRILQSRQTAIAYLAHNTQLHAQLGTLLTQFNQHEPCFEHIMQPASDIEKAALKEFYFSSNYFKKWNYSPAGVELGYVAHCGNLCSSMVQHVLAFAIFTWGLQEQHTCAVHPPKKCSHDDHDHHHHHGCDHPVPTPNAFQLLIQSTEFRQAFAWWHGIAQIQELYAVGSIIRSDLQCVKKLQAELMDISRGMHTINNIHALLENHPELTALITDYNDLEHVCSLNHISKKLHTLLALLKTPTFKGDPSIFSRMGVILVTYKLAKEIAHELKPALAAIGEIDAYNSCAQLYNEHASSSCRYSFADYIVDAETPYLSAHNFWHPLVTTQNIQLNSISLGADNTPRHIILTGPNACGKSTNVKALTLCAYLAQTITLVPAQNYSQTLYKEIYSSMVVTDNITQNMSLFVTELNDAEELLTRIENLTTHEYMLITLDELFKSTHHEKGQLIAQRLLEKLYESPQVMVLVSTHFEKLIELARTSNGMCANYTINNFILEPGTGSSEKSFDIVRSHAKSRLL
jgi:hypothetical protein